MFHFLPVLPLADSVSTAAGSATSSGAAAGTSGSSIITIILYVVIFGGAMYFILFRPQRKKTKKEQAMRNNIQVGDEVVTIGGIYGRVVSLKEDSLILESSMDHSKMRVARWAVQNNQTVHDTDTPTK